VIPVERTHSQCSAGSAPEPDRLAAPTGGTETGLQIEIVTAVLRLTAGGTTLADYAMSGALLATSGGISAKGNPRSGFADACTIGFGVLIDRDAHT